MQLLAKAAEPAAANGESLAVQGGKLAVTLPREKQRALFHWPQYGQREKEAVMASLDGDEGTFYRSLPELEAKWRSFNEVPFAKTHMNGTSAVADVFRAGSAAGQRDHGAVLHFLRRHHYDAILRLRARVRRRRSATATFDAGTCAEGDESAGPRRGADALLGPALRDGPYLRLRQGARI